MSHLYFHIPFCRQACSYCDFHFSTNLSRMSDMTDSLLRELEMRVNDLAVREVDTIYFGGGTPSLLSVEDVTTLLEASSGLFKVSKDAEITLEANPDDLEPAKLRDLKSAGVNRLSIGIQSFEDQALRLMRRSHNAAQARQVLRDAREAGFENISIDLIYGIPDLSREKWLQDLQVALSFAPGHISAYALTVESRTLLADQVRKGKTIMPPDEAYRADFEALIDQLEAAGYTHYEISNFARPGFRSRHNSAYWSGRPYLGIGPSAHGFFEGQRYWNLRNNAKYLKALSEGRSPEEGRERLSAIDRFNEALMTGLRRTEGIEPQALKQAWGLDLEKLETERIEAYIQEGFMERVGSALRFTRSGKFMSDGIIAALFQIPDEDEKT